jgi:hypothetical protein
MAFCGAREVASRVDEGTAIFKCTNDPPGAEFGTFEGEEPDFYLKLVGRGGRLIRGEDVRPLP